MRNKRYLLLVIITLLLLVGWTGDGKGQRSNPGSRTWEYLVDDAYNDRDTAQRELNRRGAEGLELTAVGGGLYYFKRAR